VNTLPRLRQESRRAGASYGFLHSLASAGRRSAPDGPPFQLDIALIYLLRQPGLPWLAAL